MRKRIISMLLTAAMVLTLMPAAFAAEGESGTVSVTIGSTELNNKGGIYIPATGNGSQYKVVEEFVPTGETEVPEGGIPYIEYKDGTMTVHGDVAFTSGGPVVLTVASGTLTITGDSDSSLTLNGGNSPAVSVSGSLKTDNYSGNLAISGASNAITGSGNVDLKTSGTISLSTTGTNSLVSAKTLSLEGDITLTAPNISASPMLSVSGDIYIKDTEGDLTISSKTAGKPIISTYGAITLSAPKGDITINSTATGSSYPTQAIYAQQGIVVDHAESFSAEGTYSNRTIYGSFTATNCPSISVKNMVENKNSGAILGDVNITGDGSKNSQAVFSSKDYSACIDGSVTIKGFETVSISSEASMAISIMNKDVDIENCGNVKISGYYNSGAAVNARDVKFKNCESVNVFADKTWALYAESVAFENCGNVSVETTSDMIPAIYTVGDKATAFTGCKSVSVKNGGIDENSPSAISGEYTCDGKITITEKGTTKIIENGKEPVITGGDVTNTGLELNSNNMPTKETVYVAGGGTITFIPAEKGKNPKLVLNNAEIRIDGYGNAIDFSDDVDIELKGTNKFIAYNGIGSDGTINISGSGTLNVEAQYYGVIADEHKDVVVNSGTLVLSGQEGIYAGKNITVEGGNITVTPSENGYGLYAYEGNITINDGTLNISSDAEDACGICAEGETDNETGKISGGNVLIHGGTVNIAVEQEAIYAYDNVKIDSDAKVMATSTDEYDGIYAYKGNIDINGNAKVTATGGCDGIHVNEGNVNIGDSAEVIATDGEDGIFASEGNITIKDNAKVTAKSKGNAAIYTNGALTIGDNAIVTADGAEGKADIYTAKGCTVSDSAKLNALVKINLGQTESKQEKYSYIAYGICDNNNITMDIDENNTLEVKSGAEFTITAGTGLSISDLSVLTLDGKLINEGMLAIGITDTEAVPTGKIVNNVLLYLALPDTSKAADVIKAMKLTGTGNVAVPTGTEEADAYTNAGKKLNNIGNIDLSDEALEGNLDEDQYHWDKDTKTLTLKDASVTEITDSLTEDVTIQTKGDVVIADIQNISGGKITVTGDNTTVMAVSNRGDIIFKDITANVYGIWNYEEDEDEPKTQALNTKDNYSYGVTLINSKITVGGVDSAMIYTKKLTMDDTSVLTLKYAELECYTADGLDGIKDYLPKDGGYKIGTYIHSGEVRFYTIVDANDNIIYDITLKKAETTKPSGGSGGGGGGGSSTQYYNITAKSAENGTVEADKKTAAKDAVVTLTVKAAEGYQLDKLTVADSKNAAIALTDKGNGKYEFKMPAQAVTVTAAFAKTQTEPATTFMDVPENAWYQTAVDYVSSKGLMNGIGNHQFGPTQLTNRGMLVTILWRMEGSPNSKQTAGFTDVKETDYFYTAVQWAAENKIVNGTSATTFAPNNSITREQLATILYRYAAYKGYDVEQGGMAIREFDDYEKISEFAKTGTAWAVNTGIISGKGNQTLDPQGVATRAEIAAMLMRFCENIAK